MNTPEYIKNLTPFERGAAIKLGACIALAQNGMTPEQFRKQADWQNNAVLLPKTMLVTALLAGIPLGVLGHAVGRATATDNRAEREALDRLRYYQRMTAGMTTGLQPANNEEDPNARGAG